MQPASNDRDGADALLGQPPAPGRGVSDAAVAPPAPVLPAMLAARWVEWLLLFVVAPVALALRPDRMPPLVALWLVMLAVVAYLLADRSFDRTALVRLGDARRWLPGIVARFVVLALVVGVAVALLKPDLLFDFPRRRPGLWALVMLVYPVVSVYPQNLVFRAFFFQRYGPLFGGAIGLSAVSAASFGFMHIVFQNGIAVALTLVGGWFFAETYRRSRSLVLASIEHFLYGCWMMTIGLGQYFYHSALPLTDLLK